MVDFSKKLNVLRVKNILKDGYDVDLYDLVPIVREGQKNYVEDVSDETIRLAIDDVVGKTDTLNAVMAAYFIDKSAREGGDSMMVELYEAQKDDASYFGVDELLGEGVARMYNTIGMSNYYHLDKYKPGIIGEVNDRPFTVMIDDLLSAIAGSAMGRLSSRERNIRNESNSEGAF